MTEILSEAEVGEAEVSLCFVGRDMIRSLNRQYLGHDYVTDVISFDLSEGGTLLVGDIYICVLQAVSQATRFGVSAEEELFRLAAHGTYHLLGYDHEDPAGQKEMYALQENAVRRYFDSRRAGKVL